MSYLTRCRYQKEIEILQSDKNRLIHAERSLDKERNMLSTMETRMQERLQTLEKTEAAEKERIRDMKETLLETTKLISKTEAKQMALSHEASKIRSVSWHIDTFDIFSMCGRTKMRDIGPSYRNCTKKRTTTHASKSASEESGNRSKIKNSKTTKRWRVSGSSSLWPLTASSARRTAEDTSIWQKSERRRFHESSGRGHEAAVPLRHRSGEMCHHDKLTRMTGTTQQIIDLQGATVARDASSASIKTASQGTRFPAIKSRWERIVDHIFIFLLVSIVVGSIQQSDQESDEMIRYDIHGSWRYPHSLYMLMNFATNASRWNIGFDPVCIRCSCICYIRDVHVHHRERLHKMRPIWPRRISVPCLLYQVVLQWESDRGQIDMRGTLWHHLHDELRGNAMCQQFIKSPTHQLQSTIRHHSSRHLTSPHVGTTIHPTS